MMDAVLTVARVFNEVIPQEVRLLRRYRGEARQNSRID